ncbi:hypothetical protein C8R47DRAFT_1191062 [Mycena vitilis]|nr:hypothetical protein C8R47DRAFT_1191062 [Mycena vitilis]
MHTYSLALLVLGATVAYAHPTASPNALVAAQRPRQDLPRALALPPRQIHNADYQANPSPSPTPAQDSSPSPTSKPAAAPSETVAKDKRADTSLKQGPGPVVESTSRENITKRQTDVEESSAAMQKRSTPLEFRTIGEDAGDQKRQIHNADYQASSPPPSPNPAPAPAPSPSPASPPAAAQSDPAAKDKRAAPPYQKDRVDVEENSADASKLVSRISENGDTVHVLLFQPDFTRWRAATFVRRSPKRRCDAQNAKRPCLNARKKTGRSIREVCTKPSVFHRMDKMLKNNSVMASLQSFGDAVWAERARNPSVSGACDGCLRRFRGFPPREEEEEDENTPDAGDELT